MTVKWFNWVEDLSFISSSHHLTFLKLMTCLLSIVLEMCKEKKFQLQSMLNATKESIKSFQSRILVYLV